MHLRTGRCVTVARPTRSRSERGLSRSGERGLSSGLVLGLAKPGDAACRGARWAWRCNGVHAPPKYEKETSLERFIRTGGAGRVAPHSEEPQPAIRAVCSNVLLRAPRQARRVPDG